MIYTINLHRLFKRKLPMLTTIIFMAMNAFAKPATTSVSIEGKTDTALLKLSEEFLYHIKTKKPTDSLELALANISFSSLVNSLDNDNAKKVFWLNMYNGWFQILATREKLKNPEIFKAKKITIGSVKFNLDEIEHGILRKFRWKYSKGYMASLFPGKSIKKLAVKKIDYRIHFALNCGAKSCPPIAFYNYEKIDKELNLAEKTYLRSYTEIDSTNKTIKVTKLMNWFAADFGGKKAVKKIIGKIFNEDYTQYKVSYKDYDWDHLLDNYAE